MNWAGGIRQKAAEVGVLQKSPVEARGIEIALVETGFHAVDDDAPRTPPEKRQGPFEAIDQGGEILLENRDHAAEPAIAERQDEALHHPRSAATEFLQAAQPAEVGFRHFAREAVGPAHRDRRGPSKATPLPRKAM